MILYFTCASQRVIDTTNGSTRWRIENKVKSRFWGNSTYISTSINLARNTEFDLNIGRTTGIATYSARGLGDYSISSWGAGYGIIKTPFQNRHTLKAFYEYVYFPFLIIGNYALRAEYVYNISDKQSYLRPSVGLSFIYVDLAYNYSFLLNGGKDENLYKHGFSIRTKYFFNKKNWERRILQW